MKNKILSYKGNAIGFKCFMEGVIFGLERNKKQNITRIISFDNNTIKSQITAN